MACNLCHVFVLISTLAKTQFVFDLIAGKQSTLRIFFSFQFFSFCGKNLVHFTLFVMSAMTVDAPAAAPTVAADAAAVATAVVVIS